MEKIGIATYSLQDDKIRIYFDERIEKELWNEFKKAGFSWTMKQDSDLVAVWTPWREDFAIKYCGNLHEEESDMLDRSADRAERFDGYLENRIKDTVNNIDNVSAIGMQSESKAEARAKKINRMRDKANLNFNKATYWHSRIEGVISHAIRKESSGVRKRRIRTLKKDLAKHQKEVDFYNKKLEKYKTMTQSEIDLLNFRDNEKPKKEELIETLEGFLKSGNASRWFDHLNFRLEYEQKVLESQGHVVLEADYKKGGKINGMIIIRINKYKGEINSFTVENPDYEPNNYWKPFECKILIENVNHYEPPTTTIKKKKKPCPTLNLTPENIKSIFGDVKIKEMTESDYKSSSFSLQPVLNGKIISRFEVKRNGLEPDFKIRGYVGYGLAANIFISLTDKKYHEVPKCNASKI